MKCSSLYQLLFIARHYIYTCKLTNDIIPFKLLTFLSYTYIFTPTLEMTILQYRLLLVASDL